VKDYNKKEKQKVWYGGIHRYESKRAEEKKTVTKNNKHKDKQIISEKDEGETIEFGDI